MLSNHPNPSKLQVGDNLAAVTEVMGEYASEFRTKSEIEASKFAHFEFTCLTDVSTPRTDAAGLPDFLGRALWFPFLTTAGTLVYLDSNDRITAVFSAGT